MHLLREYIRRLLSESSIHPKIMSIIDRLESGELDDVEVRIDGTKTAGSVTIYDTFYNNRLARVEWESPQNSPTLDNQGPCLGAVMVSMSDSLIDGLGPLAYDIAIETTGGLIADRGYVSDDAVAVWNYYMGNRPDVEAVQLDNLENDLTKDESDNCDQWVAVDDLAYRDRRWVPSALSKMYRKSGTPVIDELKYRGLLVEE